MNKEITIYELLGLIKDNKTDDDTYIKYYDRTLENEETSYVSLNCIIDLLFSGKVMLNDKVEILVEILEEDKDIAELKIKLDFGGKFITSEYGNNCYIKLYDETVINKLNEIIREVNKLRKENR